MFILVSLYNTSHVTVYVVAFAGDSGDKGLQTTMTAAIPSNGIAVGAIDSLRQVAFVLYTPDGKSIPYFAGSLFGPWESNTRSTIVVNG